MRRCVLAALVAALLLAGCGRTDRAEKLKDLEFTVLDPAEAPEALRELIREKQETNFKITYSDKGYLYIAVGYGEKPTDGYSIAVKELYLTENTVCIRTELIGPPEEEWVAQKVSYPYVIVKLEDRQEPVTFQ